jgi:hypothetical protein
MAIGGCDAGAARQAVPGIVEGHHAMLLDLAFQLASLRETIKVLGESRSRHEGGDI